MSRTKATGVGFSAVIMWGLLAFLSKHAGAVPPLQLLAMCFFIGGLFGLGTWAFRPGASHVLRTLPWQLWALYVSGLFGCHLLYFIAVRNAPVVEVSLIAYLCRSSLFYFQFFFRAQNCKPIILWVPHWVWLVPIWSSAKAKAYHCQMACNWATSSHSPMPCYGQAFP